LPGTADVFEHHRAIKAIDDSLDDGQAEAGTILARPAAAEERLEDSIDVGGRDTRSAVLDLHDRFAALAIDPDIDAAASGREAHGIVEQVKAIDRALEALRASAPDAARCNQTVAELLSIMDSAGKS
jgi:hypothetical protein